MIRRVGEVYFYTKGNWLSLLLFFCLQVVLCLILEILLSFFSLQQSVKFYLLQCTNVIEWFLV